MAKSQLSVSLSSNTIEQLRAELVFLLQKIVEKLDELEGYRGDEIAGPSYQKIDFVEDAANLDNKKWRILANDDQLAIKTASDNLKVFGDIMLVDRTGTTVDTVNFKPTTLQYNGAEVATRTFVTDITDPLTVRNDRVVYSLGLGFTSNTTLADFSSTWDLTASKYYQVEFTGFCFENGGGLKLQFVCSQTPASVGYLYYEWEDESGTTGSGVSTTFQSVLNLTAMTNNENFYLRIIGTFQANATTAGTVKLQAAQVVSNANTTYIHGGTSITVREET